MYKILLTSFIVIGMAFSTYSAVSGEVDCIPKPQLEIPVCKDMPLGPRFWGRR